MKALLLLSMFSFSAMAFSATQSDIVDAIDAALDAHALTCSRDGGSEYSSSEFGLSVLKNYEMKVSRDTQPTFVFETKYDDVRETVSITTDSTFTLINRVEVVAYQIESTRRNVGTLVDPVFRIFEERKILRHVICK